MTVTSQCKDSYKTIQGVITFYDSSDYYKLRQHVVTICDRYVITNYDKSYYNKCVKRRNVESVVITQKKSESSQRESNP